MSATSGAAAPVHDFISIPAFKAVLWLSVGLMAIAFTTRVYIRIVCFRRLLIEDWLMLLSLCMFIANAIIGTIYMQPLYDLSHLVNGSFTPGPDFEERIKAALQGLTATAVLTDLGIWIIKFNFLLFFYRLGHQLLKFRVLWWVVLVLVVASGAGQIALTRFQCLLGDTDMILAVCGTADSLREARRLSIISITLDIFTDLLIICFPISILWSSGITLRQKVVLSAIFSLVGFTIAVAIARSGFSSNTEDLSSAAGLNISFNFWFTVEYLVSFLIACIVSFRSLFLQKHNKESLGARQRAEQQHARTSDRKRGSGGLRRWVRGLHSSLLETCRELEGADAEYDLPMPASGLMAVDFSRGEAASDWTNAPNVGDRNSHISTEASDEDSAFSLKPTISQV